MAFNPLELVKAVVTGEVVVKGVTKAVSLLYGQEIANLLASVKAAGVQGTPTNHDLERGIRLAQITASLVVVLEYAKAEEREQLTEGVFAPDPFIAPALEFLRGQAGLCASLSITRNDELVALLETGLNAALSEAGRGAESATTRSHRRVAEQEVWAELLAGVPGATPREALRRRFYGEEAEEPGWFACFIAFFREALKENPKIRVPFFVGRIGEILGQQRATLALLGRLRGEVAEGFDRIETEAERRHREVLQAIAGKMHVPIAPLAAVLRRLGEADVPSEAIPARLEAAAERLLELEARLSQPSQDRPETATARARARSLLDAGDLDGAEAALRDARGALRERREQTAREEAALLGDEADIARLRLDYPAEADLHREAARLLDFDAEAAWAAWMRVAGALYRNGDELGDPAALRAAVAVLEADALPRAPREARPLDWAATQNNLGATLRTLGERGNDDALAKAVAAYENALLERTRERAPLDWAMTQNSLGNALQTLGERGSEDALAKAIAAYENALLEVTRERAPIQWAWTQNSLGSVLRIVGQRGNDDALAKAVAAYEAALLEYTRECAPLHWAGTQNNLGNALHILGERGNDDALTKAVTAYDNALLECTRERAPLDWARTQNNLGNALAILGERGIDHAVARAVVAYENALLEYTRERAPLPWATVQNNFGNVLAILGQRGDDDALGKAVAAYESALLEYTRERTPVQWAMTQENMALAEMALGDRGRGTGMWRAALARVEAALEEYRPRSPYDTERAERLAAKLRARLTPPE